MMRDEYRQLLARPARFETLRGELRHLADESPHLLQRRNIDKKYQMVEDICKRLRHCLEALEFDVPPPSTFESNLRTLDGILAYVEPRAMKNAQFVTNLSKITDALNKADRLAMGMDAEFSHLSRAA